MGRNEYRAAASAYRAKRRKVHGISMYCESAPLNANRARERIKARQEIAALPSAPRPQGFNDPVTKDRLVYRRDARKQIAAENREDRATLARRAHDRAENARLGIVYADRYSVPDHLIEAAIAERTSYFVGGTA